MPILHEYAITPDVFDCTRYRHPSTATVSLSQLKAVVLNEALVRDLRGGDWRAHLHSTLTSPLHRRAVELVKKLHKQNRLRVVVSALPASPSTDSDWCDEALASHGLDPLSGIIATEDTAHAVGRPEVGAVTCLNETAWWPLRQESCLLQRTAPAYLEALRLIMCSSNSVMFIDAYIDPQHSRYDCLLEAIKLSQSQRPKAVFELHRVCYFDGSDRRNQHTEEQWRSMFNNWGAALAEVGLTAEVFIWDDFHDRYLVSNIVGVELPRGFDTTTDETVQTRWTRLGPQTRDDVQLEFHPSSRRHRLYHHFVIGADDAVIE